MTLTVDGKTASRLIQGTAQLSPLSAGQAGALLDAVAAAGATTFDLAENYGAGAAETAFGDWLSVHGGREGLFLITKGGHPYGGRGRITREDVEADLAGSLARLRCERVELYLLHRDDESVPVSTVMAFLHELRRSGRVGAYGISNWRWQRVEEANAYAREHGLEPLAASSPHFSLAVPLTPPWPGCVSIAGAGAEADRAFYARTGMPVLAWSSLAMGYFAAGADAPQVEVSVFDTPANAGRRERVQRLASARGLTPSQVALMYALEQPMEMHAIVGCRSGDEYRELAAAAAERLTPEEVAFLEGPAPARAGH